MGLFSKKPKFERSLSGVQQEAAYLLNEIDAERARKSPKPHREQPLSKKSLQETEALLKAAEARRPIAQSARNRVPQIIKGLKLDGMDANDDLITKLAQLGTDGYRQSHNWSDANLVNEVFQEEYREGLGKTNARRKPTGEPMFPADILCDICGTALGFSGGTCRTCRQHVCCKHSTTSRAGFLCTDCA